MNVYYIFNEWCCFDPGIRESSIFCVTGCYTNRWLTFCALSIGKRAYEVRLTLKNGAFIVSMITFVKEGVLVLKVSGNFNILQDYRQV